MLRVSLLSSLVFSVGAAEAGSIDERAVMYDPTPAQVATVERLSGTSSDRFEAKTFVLPDGSKLPYRLLSPLSEDNTKPLVLVMPGSNTIGDDNTGQLVPFAKAWAEPEIAERFPAYVVVPQVGTRSAEYRMSGDGLLASQPGSSLPGVLALIKDLTETLPVDPTRIYVVGFSMGASAALNALVSDPDRFAGIVAFSGVPPKRELASDVSHIPAMLIHGTKDDQNPIAADKAWARALARAGGEPIFVSYKGMGHRVPANMFTATDWREWLFAQSLGNP
ncbi:carboxylesterase family protein [Microvirga rosea]|uniref:carboxylesterase family protein n=1 Tax=Microvirga rosea TaxID=2715425 RepID=UPI001D0B530E|nr:dienelactone hydrolase family protein [Microvirga rosea]MCB8819392.1 dienelactone hydrolase family protein [Microvirga rosea]